MVIEEWSFKHAFPVQYNSLGYGIQITPDVYVRPSTCRGDRGRLQRFCLGLIIDYLYYSGKATKDDFI